MLSRKVHVGQRKQIKLIVGLTIIAVILLNVKSSMQNLICYG